jgi:hypothetical protein
LGENNLNFCGQANLNFSGWKIYWEKAAGFYKRNLNFNQKKMENCVRVESGFEKGEPPRRIDPSPVD